MSNSKLVLITMKNTLIILTIIAALWLPDVTADTLYYLRNLTCVQIQETPFGQQQCNRWNESTKMYFYIDFFHLCFPEGTLVQSENGPVSLQELQVGEKVLTWNQEKKRKEFSAVVGWISRDTDALSAFTLVQNEDENQYIMSPLHNIAVQSNQNESNYPQFHFANSLIEGDRLVHAHGRSKQVRTVKMTEEMRGLYSPLTFNSNFYIYPFRASKNTSITNEMVLVHCYSQIKSPNKYERFLTPLLAVASFFSDQHQENYANPLYTKLRYFLQEDWKDQSHAVRYDLAHLALWQKGNNLRTASSTSAKKSHSSHSSSHSSSNNRRRARKKSAVKMFSLLSIMKNTIFNV